MPLQQLHADNRQNNGNTRQYRNKTVCVGCTDGTFEYLSLFFCLFMLCSASAKAPQTVFSNSSYESTAKCKTYQIFRGQTVGAHLAGASVTKTATLSGVSRAVVNKVMTAYTNHGNTSSAKSNGG